MSILNKRLFKSFYSLLLLCGMLLLSSQTPHAKEYQIKAVFLFNFTQFIEWPSFAFPEAKTPMVIGILGADPFGSYLDKTINKEEVNGHPLIVRRYRSIEEVKTCHILFISQEETKNMEKITKDLKGKNVLTVSDANDFIEQGGMIRFFTINNKIHFQINPAAAKNEGLTISSKLLKVAEIIIPPKKK